MAPTNRPAARRDYRVLRRRRQVNGHVLVFCVEDAQRQNSNHAGKMNSMPARSPLPVGCSSDPIYLANGCDSAPGSSMPQFRVRRNRSSEIQFLIDQNPMHRGNLACWSLPHNASDGVLSRMIVQVGPFCRKGLCLVGPFCRKGLCLVGPFCRKGLSPSGEPPWVAHQLHVAAWPTIRSRLSRWSRRGREVLLGKQDLPKSTTAPPPAADAVADFNPPTD